MTIPSRRRSLLWSNSMMKEFALAVLSSMTIASTADAATFQIDYTAPLVVLLSDPVFGESAGSIADLTATIVFDAQDPNASVETNGGLTLYEFSTASIQSASIRFVIKTLNKGDIRDQVFVALGPVQKLYFPVVPFDGYVGSELVLRVVDNVGEAILGNSACSVGSNCSLTPFAAVADDNLFSIALSEFDTDGNFVSPPSYTITYISAVPLPTSSLLLLGGTGALIAIKRKQRRV